LRAHGRGAGCRCAKSYEAFAWDKREGKKVRKTFSGERAHSEAKAWRDSKTIELRQPGFTASGKTAQPLLRDAADAFLEAAETGVAESRNREPYKAATLRGYARDLARICDDLGAVALDELTPKDVRGLVGRLKASGASGQSVRNCIVSLQALYRFYRHDVTNPCRDIGADLPRPGQRRERAATPSEAAALLDALPEEDRALWGDGVLLRPETRRVAWPARL